MLSWRGPRRTSFRALYWRKTWRINSERSLMPS